jgi:hypothetical protein
MILHGTPARLEAEALVTTAAWAFKTAVVVDHMRTTHRPFFPPDTRQAFMETLTPPEGVQVWLGKFVGHRARRGHFTTHYLSPRTARLNDFQFYVVTFLAGYVIFQVVAARWAKRTRRTRPLPLLTHEQDWNRVVAKIWPGDGTPVQWPPSHFHLSDRSLDAFTYRWARIPL